MSRSNVVLAILVAIAAASLGYFSGRGLRSSAPTAESPAALARLMETRFPDFTGQYQTLAQGKGHVQVVNFWATWCPPCREEMPELSRMADDYRPAGVKFAGIAVDEAAAVARYLTAAPVSYPVWLGDPASMQLTAALGNASQALPFTLILGRDGRVAYVKVGMISAKELRAELDGLLRRP